MQVDLHKFPERVTPVLLVYTPGTACIRSLVIIWKFSVRRVHVDLKSTGVVHVVVGSEAVSPLSVGSGEGAVENFWFLHFQVKIHRVYNNAF